LTASIVLEARKLIDEVEAIGGMTKAVESGMPKLRIERSAALKQARIDRREEVVVGVNRYQPQNEQAVEILDIDNTAVREGQIRRLEHVRAARDASACQSALGALTEAAARGSGNLLELAVIAARARERRRDFGCARASLREAQGGGSSGEWRLCLGIRAG